MILVSMALARSLPAATADKKSLRTHKVVSIRVAQFSQQKQEKQALLPPSFTPVQAHTGHEPPSSLTLAGQNSRGFLSALCPLSFLSYQLVLQVYSRCKDVSEFICSEAK